MRASLAAIVLFAALGVGAELPRADDLPALGDGSSGIVSPAAERELARAALMQIRAGVPTVDDPILKYFVRLNVFRLAEKSDLSEAALSTVLIDSPQINAFAVPGGIVGINLGLFLHARDESEYSAVVAHRAGPSEPAALRARHRAAAGHDAAHDRRIARFHRHRRSRRRRKPGWRRRPARKR